jgi:hypothetical protein
MKLTAIVFVLTSLFHEPNTHYEKVLLMINRADRSFRGYFVNEKSSLVLTVNEILLLEYSVSY